MTQHINTYFAGEKFGGLVFGLSGLVAVLVAMLVWRYAAGYKAMLWPLLIVAALELGVCAALQLRTDGQVARLQERLRTDPAGCRATEKARMQAVMRNFKMIEIVEILALVTGIALALWLSHRQTAFAVALGLILQMSAMLVADLTAEQRARPYLAALSADS